jgi:hypothetical protein
MAAAVNGVGDGVGGGVRGAAVSEARRMRAEHQNLGGPQFRASVGDVFFTQAPNFPDGLISRLG